MESISRSAPSSSRILFDVLCVVCLDHSSGKHYGVYACDGCAGFFKRSVRRDRSYLCKARNPGACVIDKAHRNQCRACRLAKCLDVGMNKDAVQHERGPRSSTIRRQMALFLKDPGIQSSEISLPMPPALNLTLPQHNMVAASPFSFYHNPYHNYPGLNLQSALPPCLTAVPSSLQLSAPIFNPADPETLCEAAARLLFMNVRWAKNVPAFASLSLSDRLLLLKESWRDLFVIGMAQFLYPVNLKILNDGMNLDINNANLELFETVLTNMANIKLDNNEYSCLRAIALFKTSFQDKIDETSSQSGVEVRKLQDLPAVAALQDHSQLVLNEYATQCYPLSVNRSSDILQLTLVMRQVPSDFIVELFFKATIGNIPIERIIGDMYRSGKDSV